VVLDSEGNVENIISTGIDITEQKRELENKVQQLEAEITRLELFAPVQTTSTNRHMYTQIPLKETQPHQFEQLLMEYSRVLEDRLEERMFKVDMRITERIKTLSAALGKMNAGPKHVVELHTQALKGIADDATLQKIQTLTEEGRVIVLELMGDLLSYYRNRASTDTDRA
jgi:capsular polysaccharide biosynthesis protein